jgi:hypothetical protein
VRRSRHLVLEPPIFFFFFIFSGRFELLQFFDYFDNFLTTFWQLFEHFLTTFWLIFYNILTIFVTFFFHFCGGSQLWKQILWIKFHIHCAYFTPNRTCSPNYSVLVLQKDAVVIEKSPNHKYHFARNTLYANVLSRTNSFWVTRKETCRDKIIQLCK